MSRKHVSRRTFVRVLAGSSLAVSLAGCSGDDGNGVDPDDGNGNGDEDEDEDEQTPPEPDYGDHFDDVENYDGTVDQRGSDSVTVMVGAGDQGLLFDPAAVRVDPGTTVVWEWTGMGGGHNVAATDGSFESETAEDEGHTFEHTFEDEGVYTYVCTPHEALGMKGAVVVGDE
ncbi:MAG: halocyanin domain-containing protein [Halobacteriota archaeon]